jgi:hypothetical protein
MADGEIITMLSNAADECTCQIVIRAFGDLSRSCLSKHEWRWLEMTSAFPFILRQDERKSLNWLAKPFARLPIYFCCSTYCIYALSGDGKIPKL